MKRVLVAMHTDLVPPPNAHRLPKKEREDYKTEFDVVSTLRKIGHEVLVVGIYDELQPLRQAVADFKPDVLFNLLEEFSGEATYDQHVVSYMEMTALPYTGCNPRGLMLARDKALGKKLLIYHRILVPDFAVMAMGRKVKRPRTLEFPLIVKSLVEEASLGISQASLVTSDEQLQDRVRLIHERFRTDAIAERFIAGREVYVSVLGNRRLQVLPIWELIFDNLPKDAPLIATRRAKWNRDYQRKLGVRSTEAKDLPAGAKEKLVSVSKRIYRILNLSGYARLDFRVSEDGKVYFLEANPNPQIAADEDFAASAAVAGISYEQLLDRIVKLGINPAL